MTTREPERWLTDPSADPELQSLLAAGRDERPPAQALRMAPLVISTLLTVPTTAVAAPIAQGAARHAIATVVLKWFAGGVLVSVAALSVTQALEPAKRAQPSVLQSASPVVRPRVSARAAPVVAAPVAPAAEPEPSAARLKVPVQRSDVAREVAILDAARVALARGQAQRALEVLAGLERLPARSLLPEATLLRVRALLAMNDVKTARKVAARFVATAPGSPQAAVLRGLFAEPLQANDSESGADKSEIQTGVREL